MGNKKKPPLERMTLCTKFMRAILALHTTQALSPDLSKWGVGRSTSATDDSKSLDQHIGREFSTSRGIRQGFVRTVLDVLRFAVWLPDIR